MVVYRWSILMPGSLLFLATIGLASITTNESTTQPDEEESLELVQKIRRQLIEDNADYEPESEDGMPLRRLAEDEYYDTYDENDSSRNNANESGDGEATAEDSLEMRSAYVVANAQENTPAAIQQPKFRATNNEKERNLEEQPISKKDLLYYMDDERLKELGKFADTNDIDEAVSEEMPKAKYKVLKSVPGSRRSGHKIPQLIQEEDANGVAILNVGDGPVPEIRLPSNRRQYMAQLGDASDSDLADGGANRMADIADVQQETPQNQTLLSRRVDYYSMMESNQNNVGE